MSYWKILRTCPCRVQIYRINIGSLDPRRFIELDGPPLFWVRWANTNTPKNSSFVTLPKIGDGQLFGGPHTHQVIYLFFFCKWGRKKNLYCTRKSSTLFLKVSLLTQYYKNSSHIMVTGKNRCSMKSSHLIGRNISKVVQSSKKENFTND